MSQTIPCCPACKSINREFYEKKSNPVYFDFVIPILAISTIFQRSKCIMRCSYCGYESSINHKKTKI